MSGTDDPAPASDDSDTEPDETRRPAPYRYDPATVPALARLADLACDGVEETHDAGMRVEKLAKQANPPIDSVTARALFTTFMYLIEVASPGEPPDARLGPVDGPSFFPVVLRDTGKEFHQLWLAV